MGLDDADGGADSDMHFAGVRLSAVAESPRPISVHHGADVGLGGGGGNRATGVEDEAVGVAEQGDELTRFRFDERGRAERDHGAGVESTPCEETETNGAAATVNTIEQILLILKYLQFSTSQRRPGVIFSDANPRFWLAGYLAETVGGKPYAASRTM